MVQPWEIPELKDRDRPAEQRLCWCGTGEARFDKILLGLICAVGVLGPMVLVVVGSL